MTFEEQVKKPFIFKWEGAREHSTGAAQGILMQKNFNFLAVKPGFPLSMIMTPKKWEKAITS